MSSVTTLTFSIPSNEKSWTTQAALQFKEAAEATHLLNIKVLSGGKKFAQGTELAAIQRGELDMATLSVSDLGAPFNALHRAYLMKDFEHVKRVYEGEFGAKFGKLVSEKLGITLLGVIYIGTRHLGTVDIAIQTPDDLKGLSLRMPAGEAWSHLARALGAESSPISIGNLPAALEAGQVKGLDNPLPALHAYQLKEITHIVPTGHLVDYLFIAISEERWTSLSDDEKGHIETAVKLAQVFNNTNRMSEEADLFMEYAERGQVGDFDLKAFKAHADSYYRTNVPLTAEQHLWVEEVHTLHVKHLE